MLELPTHDAFRSMPRFHGLDGVRAFAILAVLWHHSDTHFLGVIPGARHGFLGVDLFFVLSGFLIVSLLLRERDKNSSIDLRAFYMRRVLRIFPLYYAVVLGLALVAWIHPGGDATTAHLEALPYLLTYTANWTHHDGLLAVAWSLCAEEQFYALWPPIERYAGRAVPWILGAVLAVNIAWLTTGFGIGADLEIAQTTFTPILLGVCLAHGLHHRPSFEHIASLVGRRWSAPALAVLLVVLCNFPGDLAGLPRLAIHLGMTALIASLVLRDDHVLSRLFTWTPLVRIGVVSYGMYLLHMFVRYGVVALTSQLGDPPGLLFVLLVPSTYVVAELSFRFFEMPFLRMKTRWARNE